MVITPWENIPLSFVYPQRNNTLDAQVTVLMIFMISPWDSKREQQQEKLLSKDSMESLEQKTHMTMPYTKSL